MNTPDEIREIYKTGSGTIRLRATWQEGPVTRGGKTIYITSVPYTVNKSTLVERIADVALSRKLPHLRRRQGSVDRRRADCAGAEERRRQAHGDGVPLQAHAAAVELPGEPDVPDADRESRSSASPSGSSCTTSSGTSSHFRLDVVRAGSSTSSRR